MLTHTGKRADGNNGTDRLRPHPFAKAMIVLFAKLCGTEHHREAGAFWQWMKRQTDDPVFKAYRKEYKKRFAWI